MFAQGVSRHTGLSLGTVTVLSSLVVLTMWIPLRQRPGVGTIANAVVVGPVLDLGVALIPVADQPATRPCFSPPRSLEPPLRRGSTSVRAGARDHATAS